MIKELEKVTEIFLADDVEADDRSENRKQLIEWEQGLEQNRLFLSWQGHDITAQISKKAKDSYKEFGIQLATDRTLTEAQRQSLFAKQDACAFVLSLTEKDALTEIKTILRQIEVAIGKVT